MSNRQWVSTLGFLAGMICSWPSHAGLVDRAYVLSPNELRVIDESDFSLVEGTVSLPGERVISWWNTLDQKRLALVTAKKAKFPAKLTVVDLEKLEVVAAIELSLDPGATIRSDSGRRGYILHRGREKKDVRPTLIAVDAVEAAVTASVELGEKPAYIFLSSDESKIGLVYYGVSSEKLARREPARFDVHEAVTLKKLGSLPLPGPVTRVWVNRIHDLIYLMDTGVDKKNPKKSVSGHVYVLDPESAELLTDLDVGTAPGPLAWDAASRRYYLLTKPEKSKTAVAALQSIVRDEITAKLELPMKPLGVTPSPDRSRFYIMEKDGITIAAGDLSGLGERVSLQRTPGNVVQHRDSSIGMVLHPASNHVTRVDFDEMRVLSDFVSGRTSARVKKGLAVAAVIILTAATNAYYASSSPYSGYHYYHQPVITPYSGYTGPKTSGVFSNDGRFAYIFNAGTGDVTVFDTKNEKVTRKIPGGHYGIHFVDNHKTVVTLGAKDFRMFDTELHEERLEMRYRDASGGGMVVHPDDVHAYLWAPFRHLRLVNFRTRTTERVWEGVFGRLIRLRKEGDEVLEEIQARRD